MKAPSGFRRLAPAVRYSLRGFRAAWQHEAAFRQECVVAAVLAPCAFALAENLAQTALLLTVTALVLVVELLNSAIEAAIDRIGAERHPLAGRAKDLGSAAVFATITLAAVVWVLVLVDRLAG